MNSDKAREWLQTVGVGLLLPAAVAWLAYASADRDVNAKMIEVAAQVLNSPVNDSTRPVREWASRMLKHYSPVPFSDTAEAFLIRFPLGGFERPLPVVDALRPARLLITPKSVTLRPTQAIDFMAVALAATGDTARIPDLTWTASGGSMTDTSTRGGRHYAGFTAGTATGDFVVVARSASARLADTARVTVQAR